jgi:hypothetical protein
MILRVFGESIMFAIAVPLLVVTLTLGADGPAIRLADNGKTVDVSGLSAHDLEEIGRWKPDDEQWASLFVVRVDKGTGKDAPPAMLGSYRVEKGLLRFVPRFPLQGGVRYRAIVYLSVLPSKKGEKIEPLQTTLLLAKPKPGPAAVVEQVYPTAEKLPENQLKFYLHFSAPMSRGELYRRVRLLDDKGKVIEKAFLELDEELWDREGKRVTIFIDPGRIKRGLKPREDLGPVLEEGKRYTLEVDKAFNDGEGNPLKESYRKTFRVGPADEAPPDPKKWKLQVPTAGDRDALVVVLPKPMEHALLNRLVWVADNKGARIAGTVRITNEETRWSFTPEKPWTAGKYELTIDTRLEDLAGNTIGQPFEVDVFRPIEREIKAKFAKLPFEVKKK